MMMWGLTKIAGKQWQWSLATGMAVLVLPRFKVIQRSTDDLNRVTRRTSPASGSSGPITRNASSRTIQCQADLQPVDVLKAHDLPAADPTAPDVVLPALGVISQPLPADYLTVFSCHF